MMLPDIAGKLSEVLIVDGWLLGGGFKYFLCSPLFGKVLAPWALFCALGTPNLSGYLLFPRALTHSTAAIEFATGRCSRLFSSVRCPSTFLKILGGSLPFNWLTIDIGLGCTGIPWSL